MLMLLAVLTAQLGGDADRAARNYAAVMRGQVAFGALSPTEQEEVRTADRLYRARAARPSARERCVAQQRLAGETPTRLEQATIDLKCGAE